MHLLLHEHGENEALTFRGTERFELVALLGRGATGIVYEAFDREIGGRVALKVLARRGSEGISAFKHEFRALQGICHPNLVELRELVFDSGFWLLVMPLVRGVPIVAYARGAMPAATDARLPSSVELDDETVRRGVARPVARPAASLGQASAARIRASFTGLARGLVALHAERKIHRDLKPSNVLVDARGNVTILDFGLVSEVPGTEAREPNELLGTPSYMSPEQAALRPLGPPSDWYSVGVMLHEALTGRLPNHDEATPLDEWPSGVPTDLSALCAELLRVEPSERPSGTSVLERLLGELPPPDVRALRPSGESIFVGREAELAVLASAGARVAAGESITVLIEGESGVGKTALVREFLSRLPRETVVLSARCYERESLPYKAIDGVVEALCKFLSWLPAHEAKVALAGQASTIARAFPAMGRLRKWLEPEASEEEVFEPHAERLRVFSALRQLLVWLARERPVVVVIDDMQWSDIDSLALLSSVMRPPSAPRLLLIAVQRSGSLLSATALPGIVLEQRLGPLSDSESADLVTRLCEAEAAAPRSDAERSRMSAEARGHPLFLHEIVRHATGASNGRHLSLRLDEALWHRVVDLAPVTRLLVELVSVAGRPDRAGDSGVCSLGRKRPSDAGRQRSGRRGESRERHDPIGRAAAGEPGADQRTAPERRGRALSRPRARGDRFSPHPARESRAAPLSGRCSRAGFRSGS